MDLDTIQNMWKEDSVIDDVMLDQSSMKIPQLHAKYISLHNEISLLSKKASQELKVLEHKKWLYYSGKASPEDYQDEPFHHKVIKSDVPHWVGVDEKVLKVEMKLEYYQIMLNTLSDILKQIHQMSYNIKNMIEWRRFVNGV